MNIRSNDFRASLVIALVFFAAVLLLIAFVTDGNDRRGDGPTPTPAPTEVKCAPGTIQITLIYASNDQQNYTAPAVERFNNAFASGNNPVTGKALASGEKPICVIAERGGSSRTMEALVKKTVKPTMFSPSVSTWLALTNYYSGREMFVMAEVQSVALTPVVMAIWESRLEAIRKTVGRQDIGWAELLDVLKSPNGWRDYGIEEGRRAVYYGHTDPRSSSTGMSALIAEFYASCRAASADCPRRLTVKAVNDPKVLAGVNEIEQLMRHYTTRTDDYLKYITKGPEYVDLVALEEVDLLFINGAFASQGFVSEFTPPERLVALYPREGTLWHERPIGILNAEWVTPEQRAAARVFIDYLLTPAVQQDVMVRGFRPVNSPTQIGYPFVKENGVTPAGPATILDMPATETIVRIQESWSLVKKPADVVLLIDVSGSMDVEGKLEKAKQAAEAFLKAMDSRNRVAVMSFNSAVQTNMPLKRIEEARQEAIDRIKGLSAGGSTALYDAVVAALQKFSEASTGDRIRAVVVLSDGQDTASTRFSLNDTIRAVSASHDDLNPVIVVPVCYGKDCAVIQLTALARASNTDVQSGSPKDIETVLGVISSFF